MKRARRNEQRSELYMLHFCVKNGKQIILHAIIPFASGCLITVRLFRLIGFFLGQ